MNTKVFAIIAIATLAVALITTAASTTNAFARHHHHGGSSSNSQSLAQSNSGCSGKCSNIGSQIQGDGNGVAISSSQ